jgi:hypothetical protein
MMKPIPLVGFVDHVDEREALIDVHKKILAGVLAAVQADPDNARLRTECIRFFDESLWAVTEITPGRKHDVRFVSTGVLAVRVPVRRFQEAHRSAKVRRT